ncbi:hypothetical protein PYW08_016319 [Mythimna loreyi]|uniref:Uncharacterized protein n=1 Tax=Mythimna loreyi TaxID=667449 RepID=A0ACC2QWN9_9NEOP|nr:hypothetical protein PYW08_016319 [Mythimna loreyi]
MYGLSVLFSSRVVSKRSIRSYSSGSTKKLLEFLADMPKATSSRIAEAQRQRQQISKKSEKYAPSTVYLQVLGSGARGAPNTLYLFTDQKRYLFNCGECTQRLAHEHKVKLSRLDHIFITSKTWRNIGGLPGLSLTLQDVGVPNITLHGPDGLDELYAATKRFVIMKDMQVTMAKCSPSEDFDDNVMSVKYVLLGPHDNILTGKDKPSLVRKPKLDAHLEKEFEEFVHDETDYYKPEQRNVEVGPKPKNGGKDVPKEKPKPKPPVVDNAMKKKTDKVLHELQKKSNCSVAYICTLKKRLGTLDLAKCVDRGVKPGPLLGQLKSGLDVMLPDGTLVMSKDVKTPDDPGPVFIVLDVPDLSYLKESEFAAHFDNGNNPPENIPAIIVHFTPPEVFHQPQYRAFMSLFGPLPRHLVLNSQNSCLGSEAVHRTQHKLHLLDPDIFPLLRDVSVPAVWNAHPPVPKTNSPVRLKGLEELKNKIALAQFQNIINLEGSAKGDGHPPEMDECDSVTKLELLAGRTLTMYHLRPKKQLDRSAEPKLHIQDYIQETMDVDGFVGSLEQFRRLVDSMRYARCDSKEFPKVVFLGTGSCIPSKTRNTSAIVLQIDENHSMLLDCGEGTFGQLVRFYGPKKVNAFLRTLSAIYISHLHADHHIGLIGVIQARRDAMKEISQAEGAAPPPPLYLLAPGQIVTWLTLYHSQFERLRADYTLIPNQNLLHDHPQHTDITSAVLAAIGVQAMTTCLVSHCPNAFGVAIEVDGKYKLTYSGDTLPCEELVTIGQNSTLLIHEATMEDELADEARTKMHSTTTQAIEMGRRMCARYTVLTHFSQRYARLPRLNAHILNDNNSVGIAFDNMQITMSDLELLPHMYAPLQLMFAEHCVEMELKAAQRQRIKERRASTPSITPESKHSLKRYRRAAACCAATPVTIQRARYRESNASRLRQEIKGMTISGAVRKPRSISSRSNSASESGSPASRKTTPRDAHSRNATPRNMSRQPSKERGNERSIAKGKQEAAVEKENLQGINARSASEIPNKETLAFKAPSNCPSGHICVDTRSKTVNNVNSGHQPTADELMEVLNHTKPRPKNTRPGAGKATESKGYGKPLVTPVNRRLTIRRDQPWPYDSPKCTEKVTPPKGSALKSPNRKAEKNESPSQNASLQRPKLISTKIPTKVTVSGNKLRESNTNPNVFPDTKIPVLRANIGPRSLRPTSSIHGKRSNSRSPQRQQKSTDRSRDNTNTPTYKLKLENKDPPEIKQWTADRMTPPRSPNRGRSPIPIRMPSADVKKKSPTSNKEENSVSQALNKETPSPPPTRLNPPGYGNRSFKPQLEDIKSSYLLLNKISQDSAKTVTKAGIQSNCTQGKMSYKVSHIVNQFNEERRRHKLIECKKKFQSNKFFEDSRFEKIEGLNWISWK